MIDTKLNEKTVESKTKESISLVFLNSLRVIAMICVIIYHAAASYSTQSLYWAIQDPTKDLFSDFIRDFLDVFIMPLFFFIAGYFGIRSLQKYSAKEFFYSKFKKLMFPWIFIILIILPFVLSKVHDVSNYSNYLEYWLAYIISVGTVTIAPLDSGEFNHIHFWYLSLLFYFFVFLMIIYYIAEKKRVNSNQGDDIPIIKRSMIIIIIIVGIIVSFGTFILLLFTAEKNWLTINFIIQFKIIGIISYAGLFGIGVYASKKNMFTNGKDVRWMKEWAIASILLTVLFFIVGGNILTNFNSQFLNPAILLVFALIRTFLCISIIFFFLSFTMKYMNKSSFFNTELAEQSFNIYLVHVFIVIAFQLVLINWVGPNAIKILIITVASLFICFALCKYIFKKIPLKIGLMVMFLLFFILPLLAIIFPILNLI